MSKRNKWILWVTSAYLVVFFASEVHAALTRDKQCEDAGFATSFSSDDLGRFCVRSNGDLIPFDRATMK